MLCGRAKCCQTNPLHRFANMCQDPELCQDILSPRTNLAQTGMDRPQFELIYSHPVQASPLCFFFFLLLTHSERKPTFQHPVRAVFHRYHAHEYYYKDTWKGGGFHFPLRTIFNFHISSSWPGFCATAKHARMQIKWNKYDTTDGLRLSSLSLRGATEHLYCNHRREPESPSSPARLSPPRAVIPMVAMSTTPARGLSWALCEEMDCRTLPKKKAPLKVISPNCSLGGFFVNPPYPSSINKWHARGEGSLERESGFRGRTLTRPIILHFHSAEQSKLEEAGRNR